MKVPFFSLALSTPSASRQVQGLGCAHLRRDRHLRGHRSRRTGPGREVARYAREGRARARAARPRTCSCRRCAAGVAGPLRDLHLHQPTSSFRSTRRRAARRSSPSSRSRARSSCQGGGTAVSRRARLGQEIKAAERVGWTEKQHAEGGLGDEPVPVGAEVPGGRRVSAEEIAAVAAEISAVAAASERVRPGAGAGPSDVYAKLAGPRRDAVLQQDAAVARLKARPRLPADPNYPAAARRSPAAR